MASRLLAVLKRRRGAATLAVAVLFLAGAPGCSVLGPGEASYPTQRSKTNRGVGINKPSYQEPESIFGPGGLSLGGAPPPDDGTGSGPGGSGIGVNSFLWRASLDTVAFMPLVSADPFGGVIITDWYTPPQSPNERFKINVFILGRTLRADGVRAAVFRQQMAAAGWVDAPVAGSTATDLENAILVRARQLRIAQTGS
jgi:hypothetical protein